MLINNCNVLDETRYVSVSTLKIIFDFRISGYQIREMEKSSTAKKTERNSMKEVGRNSEEVARDVEKKMETVERINENSKVVLSRRINVLVNPEEKI